MFARTHRLKQPVTATAIDDDGRARFTDETLLPEGTELRVVSGRLPWREGPPAELFYTIEVKGSRYRVRAEALDPSI